MSKPTKVIKWVLEDHLKTKTDCRHVLAEAINSYDREVLAHILTAIVNSKGFEKTIPKMDYTKHELLHMFKFGYLMTFDNVLMMAKVLGVKIKAVVPAPRKKKGG